MGASPPSINEGYSADIDIDIDNSLKNLTIISRNDIISRILNGEHIVIEHNRRVLAIPDAWLQAHPGGDLAILHFVGRDAGDEIDAYHPPSVRKRMKAFTVGRVDDTLPAWDPLIPPIMAGWVRRGGKWFHQAEALRVQAGNSSASPAAQVILVDSTKPAADQSPQSGPAIADLFPPESPLTLELQAQHSKAYVELHQRIVDAGLYQCRYLSGYGPEVFRYILFAVLSFLCYRHSFFFLSAVFLGLLWHQLTFTVHDLGHLGVTHNWVIDRLIGITIADFIGGLSIAWWVDNHNVHHLVTNHPSHDPDIEHVPFFAISPHFLGSLYSTYYKRLMTFDWAARIFLTVQHQLFYIIMSLARFNLYANSYAYLWKSSHLPKFARGGKRFLWCWRLEVLGMLTFWTWYTRVLIGCGNWKTALMYLLVSNVVPSPLHVQIVLSHFSRSTEDLGPHESFPHRQLRTTTDVICPDWLAFLHGGLHLQVTHHLFPRLPRHNLRKASKLVKEFAQEQGLEYFEFGFVEGNEDVRDVLANVAAQARVVKMVADAEIREAIFKQVPKSN